MAFRIGRRQNDSGYDKNVGKDFRSFIMKTSAGYGKRSSIKMPHDESPDHPRYINGVPYIVPLQSRNLPTITITIIATTKLDIPKTLGIIKLSE